MNAKAERKRDSTIKKASFFAWTRLKLVNGNMGPYYYRRYLLKICRKCIRALDRHAEAKRAYVAKLKAELDKRISAKGGVDLPFVLKQITRLQTRHRGQVVKAKFDEMKITKLFAIQVTNIYLIWSLLTALLLASK